MKNTIVTIGMFDGVHLGHRHILQHLLSQSQQQGLEPVVLTFSRHPRQMLSKEPFGLLNTFEERMALLRDAGVGNIKVVDFTFDLASQSACEFYDGFIVPELHPSAMVFGYDNTFGNRQHNDFSLLRERLEAEGVALYDADSVLVEGEAVSSTRIRKALEMGDITLANRLLGYHYSLSGEVCHGRGIGHTLGFATANVSLDASEKHIPLDGVYAVAVSLEGKTYRGVANLGPQPTIAGTSRVFEVHLIGYDQELYGSTLRVDFLGRIRDIRRFESCEALAAQIAEDVRLSLNLEDTI